MEDPLPQDQTSCATLGKANKWKQQPPSLPDKNSMCFRSVVCTWVGARPCIGEVFICITLRLLSQVHGVHLHRNLYSSKPVLAYMHTYIHPHAHTWTLVQCWLGVGPIMGQSDPCSCHYLCHIEGPADPKGWWQIESIQKSFPSVWQCQRRFDRRPFKICSTFTAFVLPLNSFWTLGRKPMNWSSESLISVFPRKIFVLQEITLFYKVNKHMNHSDLTMVIYQKGQCEEGTRDSLSEWVCSSWIKAGIF